MSCQNLPKLAKTPGIPSCCLVKPWKTKENNWFCCILHHLEAGTLPKPLEPIKKSWRNHKKIIKNRKFYINFMIFYDFFYDFHLVSCQNLPKLAKTPGIPSFCLVKPWKTKGNHWFCCILHHLEAGTLPKPLEPIKKSLKNHKKHKLHS